MNIANLTNTSNIDEANLKKSLSLLQAALGPNCFYVVLGPTAVVFNLITVSTIWKSKSLHTKCFILLGVNALVDFLLGVGYTVVASLRLYRFYSGVGDICSMWTCFQVCSFLIVTQLLALAMAPALVVERLLGTFFPLKYKNLDYTRVTLPMVFSICLYSFGQTAFHFHDSYLGEEKILFTCGVPDTLGPDNTDVLTSFQIATSIAVVLLNCLLGAGIRWRNKKVFTTTSNGAGGDAARDKDRKCFKSITLIAASQVLTHLGGRLAIYLATVLANDDVIKTMTNRWGRTLVVLSSSMHFFLLFGTSAKFRQATIAVLRGKKGANITSSAGPISFGKTRVTLPPIR